MRFFRIGTKLLPTISPRDISVLQIPRRSAAISFLGGPVASAAGGETDDVVAGIDHYTDLLGVQYALLAVGHDPVVVGHAVGCAEQAEGRHDDAVAGGVEEGGTLPFVHQVAHRADDACRGPQFGPFDQQPRPDHKADLTVELRGRSATNDEQSPSGLTSPQGRLDGGTIRLRSKGGYRCRKQRE